MKPKNLYLKIIKIITNINPSLSDTTPASMESLPRSGPTVLSSTTLSGVGRAPERSSNAKSVAS